MKRSYPIGIPRPTFRQRLKLAEIYQKRPADAVRRWFQLCHYVEVFDGVSDTDLEVMREAGRR